VQIRSADHGDGRIESVELSSVATLAQSGDVVASRPDPSPFQQRWTELPARWRRAGAVAAVLVAIASAGVVGGIEVRDRLQEQRAREEIRLGMSIGVWASSSTPPGGHVTYYLRIRNSGLLPLEVLTVHAADDRVVLTARDAGARLVAAGDLVSVPLSIRLTCSAGTDAPVPQQLVAEVAVRRGDGRVSAQRPILDTALVDDAADRVCSVRPGVRDYELSGPIMNVTTAGGAG